MNELHLKYRPKSWDEVVGHGAVVKSLKSTMADGSARAFLFTGPPGVGKTTMARLIARNLDIDPERDHNYREFDGATNTGVDDMRAILDMARYRPMGKSDKQVFVIDEAHMLSKSAWNSALKSVEEPPPGVYWVFCTSEGNKVPAAIRSRCQEFALNPVPAKDLDALLDRVLKEEKLKTDDAILDLVMDSCAGSPRNLLVALSKVAGLEPDDIEGAEKVLQALDAEGNKDVADFCRALSNGANFGALAGILKRMDGVTAEGVRAVVCVWFTKVALGAKNERNASRSLAILSAFGDPYPAGIGSSIYPVLVSLGKLFDDS